MRRELAAAWRGRLLSTACNASVARALIGATTSRLAGLWLIHDDSVDTVWILCFFGQCAELIEFHRGRFTDAPRRGERHEKPHCGEAHSPATGADASQFPSGSPAPEPA